MPARPWTGPARPGQPWGMRDADRTNVYEQTGGACTARAGDCERVECRFNLLDPGLQRLRARRRKQVATWSCALAAADAGPVPAEMIARCMGVTRARIGQIELQAIKKVRKALAL